MTRGFLRVRACRISAVAKTNLVMMRVWGLLRRFRFGFGRFGEQDFFFKGFAAGVLQGFQCGGAVTSCRVKLGVVRRLVFGISSTLPTGLSAGAPGRIADHAGPCGPILREPVLSPPRSFRQ